MTFKKMKTFLLGKVKTFDSKKVFYMNPLDLMEFLSYEDRKKIENWNGICIYPSPGKVNNCFYFYWGYGGSPEQIEQITIREKEAV